MYTDAILQKILTEKISDEDAVKFDNKQLVYELRELVTESDSEKLVKRCYDDTYSNKVKCLYITLTRKYCTIDPVRQLIKDLWGKADNILKEGILWRLLDDKTLQEEWHRKIFQYVNSNYSTYFTDSIITYYGNGQKGMNGVIDSLNDSRFPDSKKWVYLYSLLVYNEVDKEKVKTIIINEKERANNKPFIREVCNLILTEHLS
jgi:hypothetical protein